MLGSTIVDAKQPWNVLESRMVQFVARKNAGELIDCQSFACLISS